MSRYIVTGGSGRLGGSIVEALFCAGHEVFSVDRSRADDLQVEQFEQDLMDGAATANLFQRLRPDGVIHLAAISVPFSAPDPVIFSTNTSLAFSVLDATVESGATQLLVASSPTVIGYGAPGGWAPQYLPIDEDHPVAPWNGYALSKVAVEDLVAMAVRTTGNRVRYGSFRPCFVLAPDEWAGAATQQGHTVVERLRNPALSAVALFNYLDARDAGSFVVAWTEHAAEIENGTCFFVGAADSLATAPMDELLPAYVPGAAELATGLTGSSAVFSSARAERLLGWRATRSWRTELSSAQLRALEARREDQRGFNEPGPNAHEGAPVA